MRELLKYAFVLAVGGAIGAYTVLSLEDGAGRPAQREAMAANFEPAPPATLTLMPANNERGLSRRPGPLAPYAQTSTAKVERLPLAERAPRSGDADAPSDTRAASKPTSPVSPPSREVTPPTAAVVAVSPEASQDPKPADEPTRPPKRTRGGMSRHGRNSPRSPRTRSAYATRTVSRKLLAGFALTPPPTRLGVSPTN